MALLEYNSDPIGSIETDELIADLQNPLSDTATRWQSHLKYGSRVILGANTAVENWSSITDEAMQVIAQAEVYLQRNPSPLIAYPAETIGRQSQPFFIDSYPKYTLWGSGFVIPNIPGNAPVGSLKNKVYKAVRLMEVVDAIWMVVHRANMWVSLKETVEFHRQLQRFAALGYPFYKYTVLRFQKDWNAFVRYSYEELSQSVGQVIGEDNKVGPKTIEAYNTALAMSGGGSGAKQRWQDTVSAASGYKT